MASGSFAHGGEPPLGQASLVGEEGPELFVPRGHGTIVPLRTAAGTLPAGPAVVQHITIHAGLAASIRAEVMELMPQMQHAAAMGVSEARRRDPELFGQFGR